MTSSKTNRAVPTQTRAKQTVSNIKETIIELLSKQPYQTITTNQIAEQANISIGSLYKYFPNKDALLLDISKDFINQASLVVKESVRMHHEKSARELLLFQTRQLSSLFDTKNSYLSFVIPVALKERSVYQLMIEQLTDSVLLYLAFNKDVYPVKNPPLTAKTMSIAVVAICMGFLEGEEIEFDFEEINQEIAKLIEAMLSS